VRKILHELRSRFVNDCPKPSSEARDWRPLKISIKYIFCGGVVVSEWLAREFTFLGVHFQNWMPLALVIVLLCIFFQWFRGWFRNQGR
jgi:disulfide bond formation protein DsbB